jgi:hypothetical protein
MDFYFKLHVRRARTAAEVQSRGPGPGVSCPSSVWVQVGADPQPLRGFERPTLEVKSDASSSDEFSIDIPASSTVVVQVTVESTAGDLWPWVGRFRTTGGGTLEAAGGDSFEDKAVGVGELNAAGDKTSFHTVVVNLSRVKDPPPEFLLKIGAGGSVTGMAVRDLTRGDALRICIYLAELGFVTTSQISVSGGRLIAPGVGTKITIAPSVVTPTGPVAWRKLVGNQLSQWTTENLAMDPRGIVLLWRLCAYVSREFGTTVIYHVHFTDGKVDPNDCHGQGRAIDLSGVEGVFPTPFPRDPVLAGKSYKLFVITHWGGRPVPAGKGPPTASYRLADDKTIDPSTGKDAAAQAALVTRRAAAVLFQPLYEEFVAKNSSDHSEMRIAYDFVSGKPQGVYDPNTGKTGVFDPKTHGVTDRQPDQDRLDDEQIYLGQKPRREPVVVDPNLPSSTVGQSQGFAIGPDYGADSQGLRGQHQNHLHFQIATTKQERFPP